MALSDLQSGMHLLLADGTTAVVEATAYEYSGQADAYIVYNFEVSDWHTYFVGDRDTTGDNAAVWVHNMCKPIKGSGGADGGAPSKVDIQKQTGSYTNTHASGKKYHGKGSRARSQKSGNRVAAENSDPHVATDWTPADSTRDAFKQESIRLDADGGVKSTTNYNKIEQPGKKYRIEDGEL